MKTPGLFYYGYEILNTRDDLLFTDQGQWAYCVMQLPTYVDKGVTFSYRIIF